MKKKVNNMLTQTAKPKPGDVIVIYGSNDFDRDLIKYTDAKDLITYIRERDHPAGNIANNKEYMQLIVSRIQEVYEGFNLPYHNEEAFVVALFGLGIFGKTTLN